MAGVFDQIMASDGALPARVLSRLADRNIPSIDTQMENKMDEVHFSKHQAAAQDATPVNMKQHYLKRKSGGFSSSPAVSSPCSPHLSRLGASLNKVSLAGGVPPATSPLTPMSEASTPLTEVAPFAADTAIAAACDDGAASWSIRCSSPHGQACTEQQGTFSLPNALLTFEENMSSPSGGLAKLAVSETREDDFVAQYSRPRSESAISGLRGESAEDAFQLRLAPRNFDFCDVPTQMRTSRFSLGENHHPNSPNGLLAGVFQIPSTTMVVDENPAVGGFSQDTVMSQDTTMDGFSWSNETRYLRDPPSSPAPACAVKDWDGSPRLDSEMTIPVPSNGGNRGTPIKASLKHLACLGDRAKSFSCDASGMSASPFRKRSRAHSPPRKPCAAPQHQAAVSSPSSPLLSLSSSAAPSAPVSEGSLDKEHASPAFDRSPARAALRRGLSMKNMSPSKPIVEKAKKLPTFQDECVLDCVSVETVQELCMGEYRDMYDKVMIIDCRFDYEYEGGHVSSNEWLSVHHVPPHRKDYMEELLYFSGNKEGLVLDNDRVCVIFHCEFSKQRGPKMMSHVRSIDRQHNHERYPLLYYPELYVMKGGYKQFFLNQGNMSLCHPMKYTPMLAEQHSDECKRQLKLMNEKKKAGKAKGRSSLMMMNSLASP